MKLLKYPIILVLLVISYSCNQDYRHSSNESAAPKAIQTPDRQDIQETTESDTASATNTINPVPTPEPAGEANFQEMQPEEPDQEESKIFTWRTGAFVSLGVNFLLILLLIHTLKAKKKWKRERDNLFEGKEMYKGRYNQALKDLRSTQDDRSALKDYTKKLKSKYQEVKEKTQPVTTTDFDEKPREYLFSDQPEPPAAPVPPPPAKVVLYAGKPSNDKTFSAVSPQQDDHRSIFRLILEEPGADRAKFEVVGNEYILKMVANAPDTYLYQVCKPENSNQNFDGKILTTEKGTARLVNGNWTINDEDKAKIKFE